MKKIDIYIAEGSPNFPEALLMNLLPSRPQIKIYLVGYARNYKNLFGWGPSEMVDEIIEIFLGMRGVYINQFPPELEEDFVDLYAKAPSSFY